MFLGQTDLYSEFDSNGFPVKDNKGEPLNKKLIKKLEKDMEKQREVHSKYLANVVKNENGEGKETTEG